LVDASFDTSPYDLDTVQWNATLTWVAYESVFLRTLACFEMARRDNVLRQTSEAVSSTDKINLGINSNQNTKAVFPTRCRSKTIGGDGETRINITFGKKPRYVVVHG
jgi:hypothetical protein